MTLMAATVRESVVEDHLVDRCADLGLLCFKTIAQGRRGLPDRMVIGHDAHGDAVTLFVELKRPGQVPRPSQVHMITALRDHGAHAVTADSMASLDALLEDYFLSPPVPIAERDPHTAPLPGRTGAVVMPLT